VPAPPPVLRVAGRPLLPLLLALTAVSGIVDAVSFLGLGHVFVANMTGNLVFIGFALAGGPVVSLPAALVGLAGFVVGALVGGRLLRGHDAHHGRHLALSTWLTVALTGLATLISFLDPSHVGPDTDDPVRHLVTGVLAVAMGLQIATVRRMRVADVTTSVVTQTLTGLVADSALAGGDNTRWVRRIGSVLSLLVGAFVGGLLVVHAGVRWGLLAASVLLLLTAVAASSLAARTPREAWVSPG
jgi:uncharacterized membrane protein YoaK (UPF0700 family)